MGAVPNLFVAAVPPQAVRRQLDDVLAPLRTELPDLGWEAPPRWHVTLCFLGQVEPVPALVAELGGVAGATTAVPVQLSGAGCFGKHVLWAGVAGQLDALAQELAVAAGRAGFAPEDRPFRPHLTLARRRRRLSLQPLAERLADLAVGPWVVDELVLLRGGRPDYAQVASWPLRG